MPENTEPKYAIYRYVEDDTENRFWLVDTGVGGTWSPNVDDANWFPSHNHAVGALYAGDFVETSANWSEQGFVILRVR